MGNMTDQVVVSLTVSLTVRALQERFRFVLLHSGPSPIAHTAHHPRLRDLVQEEFIGVQVAHVFHLSWASSRQLTTLPMSTTHTHTYTNKVTGGWVNTLVVVIDASLAASEAEV